MTNDEIIVELKRRIGQANVEFKYFAAIGSSDEEAFWDGYRKALLEVVSLIDKKSK